MPSYLIERRSYWLIIGAVGCAAPAAQVTDAGRTDAGGAAARASSCLPCLITADCSNHESCAELSADLLCVAACTTDTDCAGSQVCASVTLASGSPAHACVASSGACSLPPPDAGEPAGHDAGNTTEPPDAGSEPPDSGLVIVIDADAGTPAADAGFTSSITADGGTESQLYFAVVGDTRPAIPDDNGGYPTSIINQIYQDIESLNPRPPFVVGTGDYQFTIPGLGGSAQQMQLGYYQAARMLYKGAFWPAMGNHECDSITGDQCGPGTFNGDTDNYTVYKNLFLTPIGETNPYYSRRVTATDGSWSARFIIVALNYWNTAQETWLQQQLAGPATTFTFVIHHEDAAAGAPSALATVEQMEGGHETLSIVGHNHLWQYNSNVPEVIVGNGGAPLDASNQNYGYTLIRGQSDGSLQVAAYDYQTNQVVNQFTIP
jgi:hypothetical protein